MKTENHKPTPQATPGSEIKATEKSPNNPFDDLSLLAVDQSFDELTAETQFVLVPLRKPNKQSFIRVSPAETHRIQLAMLELDGGTVDRPLFIIPPTILPSVSDLPGISHRIVMLAVARPENTPFLWPIKTPNEKSGRKDSWGRSALEIARLAMKSWVRVTPNMLMGCYVATVAKAEWPEPVWPELTMNELLKLAVGETGVITTLDHPAVKALRGEK